MREEIAFVCKNCGKKFVLLELDKETNEFKAIETEPKTKHAFVCDDCL